MFSRDGVERELTVLDCTCVLEGQGGEGGNSSGLYLCSRETGWRGRNNSELYLCSGGTGWRGKRSFTLPVFLVDRVEEQF